MYKLSEIREIHLEPTSKCQAGCPMCGRNIQGGMENPRLHLTEITLEQFKQWVPEQFVRQLHKVILCGNTGDPIIAKDTLEICRYLREANPDISLSMNTNGSARSANWWTELAQTGVRVRFGLDGLADTHHLYRIGTDWQHIIDNASAFIQAGGQAVWDMLVFDHNKHQVTACEELSKQLGFAEFIVKHTSRFKEEKVVVLTRDGKVSHTLYPSIKSQDITKKITLAQSEDISTITCKVLASKGIYISAQGQVTPCCWTNFDAIIPTAPAVADYNERNFNTPSLQNNTLSEIFDSGYFEQIESTWSDKPLKICSKQCGKVDKFNEQFK